MNCVANKTELSISISFSGATFEPDVMTCTHYTMLCIKLNENFKESFRRSSFVISRGSFCILGAGSPQASLYCISSHSFVKEKTRTKHFSPFCLQ